MSNWRYTKLGDIAKVYDGTHQTPNYVDMGVPFYSVEHVTSGNFNDTKYVAREVFEKENQRVKIEKDDILMTRIGDVGTAKLIDWNVNASFYVSLALIKCKINISSSFIAQLINSEEFRREIWSKTIHVAFPNKINLGDISKCNLSIPDIQEQERIVSILETWDEYLEKLDKKIELKKNIKKGLTQQLLSGKNRVYGFNKDWRVVKLGDISKIKTGKKDNQNKVKSGAYPFFVRSPIIERINSFSYDGEAILVPGEGNIGKIFHYINGKFDFHQRVYKISDFGSSVSGKYIHYYFMQNFSREVSSMSVKATVDSLRLPTFTNFKVYLPQFEEQKAIVEILDAISNEINLLCNKKAIIDNQKTFLVNNLITGKIRTPEDLKVSEKIA